MQDYIKIIEDDMPEQIQFLQDLIRINSEGSGAVTAADGSVYPFGQGVQDALELVLKACEDMGFRTHNADNYGAHAEFGDEGKIMGILTLYQQAMDGALLLTAVMLRMDIYTAEELPMTRDLLLQHCLQ